MRFEFHDNGTRVGSAQWEGPGQIHLEVEDEAERTYLTEYFAGEMTYLCTPFDEDEDAFQIRRRDWTPWEFERACVALARTRGYRVHMTPSEPVEARPQAG
ncbi:MAG TPA: hypothetical protein VEO00_03970 [Actinomycetota bacterium]|nr:hypothetical protein [Actinomycetota bacterium]